MNRDEIEAAALELGKEIQHQITHARDDTEEELLTKAAAHLIAGSLLIKATDPAFQAEVAANGITKNL